MASISAYIASLKPSIAIGNAHLQQEHDELPGRVIRAYLHARIFGHRMRVAGGNAALSPQIEAPLAMHFAVSGEEKRLRYLKYMLACANDKDTSDALAELLSYGPNPPLPRELWSLTVEKLAEVAVDISHAEDSYAKKPFLDRPVIHLHSTKDLTDLCSRFLQPSRTHHASSMELLMEAILEKAEFLVRFSYTTYMDFAARNLSKGSMCSDQSLSPVIHRIRHLHIGVDVLQEGEVELATTSEAQVVAYELRWVERFVDKMLQPFTGLRTLHVHIKDFDVYAIMLVDTQEQPVAAVQYCRSLVGLIKKLEGLSIPNVFFRFLPSDGHFRRTKTVDPILPLRRLLMPRQDGEWMRAVAGSVDWNTELQLAQANLQAIGPLPQDEFGEGDEEWNEDEESEEDDDEVEEMEEGIADRRIKRMLPTMWRRGLKLPRDNGDEDDHGTTNGGPARAVHCH
jgi:hypothetical protein